MYQNLKGTCRAIDLLIKLFVLRRWGCRRRRVFARSLLLEGRGAMVSCCFLFGRKLNNNDLKLLREGIFDHNHRLIVM